MLAAVELGDELGAEAAKVPAKLSKAGSKGEKKAADAPARQAKEA